MSIEADFDVPFVAALALREKQIQQNYRPVIAVHKWFARRPGTLFRALLLAEFGNRPLREVFYDSNDLSGLVVADPFMGGGTPIVEANRLGCDVMGFDVNPMAAWIVREEIEHIDLAEYRQETERLLASLANSIGHLYMTDCVIYGDRAVPVKYFLWVKTISCDRCGDTFDLFPGYVIADDSRHPKNVVVCATCGELNEVADLDSLPKCLACRDRLVVAGAAARGQCRCPKCGLVSRYPAASGITHEHRLFAIEYFNPTRKRKHAGRFFKRPDVHDIEKVQAASDLFKAISAAYVPNELIPSGDETKRLHRWGYRRYCDLFNYRQLLGLEYSCRHISAIGNERLRNALATNLSDLLRYQNMLCRYDTTALKSLDIFSIHGFPVGLVQCESNLLGIANSNGLTVGSGGWLNIVEKYIRAKKYCDEPFEFRYIGGKKRVVPIIDEWIGDRRDGSRPRAVRIECLNSADVQLAPASIDAIVTDPPYFGNVQYGELMEFCYTWLRRLVPTDTPGFGEVSGRSINELTGNITCARGIEQFAEGLASIFSVAAKALKPNAPLAFTFHHNHVFAYSAIAVAVLDAGLVCTASPPCPAEMSGSIHINGTASSITDTIFICRKHAATDRRSLSDAAQRDVADLEESGMRPHLGDVRCVVMGHATRLAIAELSPRWDVRAATNQKLRLAETAIGPIETVVESLCTAAMTEKRRGVAHDRRLKAKRRTMDLF